MRPSLLFYRVVNDNWRGFFTIYSGQIRMLMSGDANIELVSTTSKSVGESSTCCEMLSPWSMSVLFIVVREVRKMIEDDDFRSAHVICIVYKCELVGTLTITRTKLLL